MTSLHLLLWIVASIVLQMVVYLSVVFWRHWTEFLALRHKVDGLGIDLAPSEPVGTPSHEPLPAAWSGWRTFKVVKKTFEDKLQTICSFELAPVDGQALPTFLPGQFLTFQLEMPGPSGTTEPLVRCYSLSDAPNPSHYRVSIKRVPAPSNSPHMPGRSSNFFHDQVAENSLLKLRAPSGHFHIDHSNTPLVLIGGGIGITPMLSMLNWCVAEQPGREVWLFYGARNSSEVVMQAHLACVAAANPNVHLHVCLSDPAPADLMHQPHLRHGRVDVALLRQLLPLKPFHFHICGPTPMLQSLVPALEDWGVPDAHIHFEAFGPASVPRKKAASQTPPVMGELTSPDIVVTFAKSGKTIPWAPAAGSLLDFAEANGIRVDSGCRAGGCGSCQTTIRSGEVSYQQSPDFDPEEGTCLLCVCAPKTHVTLEA